MRTTQLLEEDRGRISPQKSSDARDLITSGDSSGDRLPTLSPKNSATRRAKSRHASSRRSMIARVRRRIWRGSARSRGAGRTSWKTHFKRRRTKLAAGDLSPLRAALQKFDAMPRTQRIQSLLLEGGSPHTARNSSRKPTTCNCFPSTSVRPRKSGNRPRETPRCRPTLPKPTGEVTNLATGVKARHRRAGKRAARRGRPLQRWPAQRRRLADRSREASRRARRCPSSPSALAARRARAISPS